MNRMEGNGAYIGVEDCTGKPIHIGDTLEFDENEFGGKCIFTIILKHGMVIHPGATDDLSTWCKIVASFKPDC